ncbi:MAG: HAD family hydrolase [Actinobacteria bacterium]|nr:HAD family hydrolase [Actinomycetota bacterium]
MLRAVLFDFGGVVLSSPFEAFNHYEDRSGLPRDFIRRVNSENPDSNAWAKLERSELSPTEFDEVFARESEALGHRVPGADILSLLHGDIRPEMVRAIDVVKDNGYLTACLTNNVLSTPDDRSAPDAAKRKEIAAILERFDALIESSKVGVRKPEPRFYEIACATLAVEPTECVFLDDLGINLKPAAAMGMKTIKVTSAAQALGELSQILSLALD